ncbi:MAG: hypothetical protein ACFB8W_20465 [Elainellaceae cyanobacterium]
MFQTEFEFTLPKGYLDGEGNLHRTGIMRLAKAADEIVPLRDPRVQANPAYATVIILSRVITRLGTLEDVNPALIEGLFAADLNFLYNLYRRINDLDTDPNATSASTPDTNAPSLTTLSVGEG